MQADGFSPRINLDGFITSSSAGRDSCYSYVQVFRNGAAEATMVLQDRNGKMVVPSRGYEEDVLEFVSAYIEFVRRSEIEPPHFLFLSFVGVRGCVFGLPNAGMYRGRLEVFEEDMVVLPEVAMIEHDDRPHRVMKPAFDMVWNAFGFTGSRNYDADGNWSG